MTLAEMRHLVNVELTVACNTPVNYPLNKVAVGLIGAVSGLRAALKDLQTAPDATRDDVNGVKEHPSAMERGTTV